MAPPPSTAGPPKIKIVGEPEPPDGDEPPSKRPALVVSKPTPGKVPQKARLKIRVRLAQDVQEVATTQVSIFVCQAIGCSPFVSTPV